MAAGGIIYAPVNNLAAAAGSFLPEAAVSFQQQYLQSGIGTRHLISYCQADNPGPDYNNIRFFTILKLWRQNNLSLPSCLTGIFTFYLSNY